MADRQREILRIEPHELAFDGRLVTDQDRRQPELSARGDGSLDHDSGTEVAPHRVDRDLHARPLAASADRATCDAEPVAGGRGSWGRSCRRDWGIRRDRKSTRLNSSHLGISYAV